MRLRGTIAPFGAVMLLGSMLAGCQKSEDAGGAKTATGDTAHGKQIFLTLCATCHGPEGAGVKGLGKNLVTSEYVHKASDEQLVEMIEKGRREGPPEHHRHRHASEGRQRRPHDQGHPGRRRLRTHAEVTAEARAC